MRPTEPLKLLRYLEARPDDARALQSLGKWYRRRGRNAEAHDVWERSLRADPCDMFTHLYLGNLFYQQGDPEAALERFQYAAMLAPEDPAPLWCQADVYESQDRQDLAREYHLQAVSVDPEDEQAARLLREWQERLACRGENPA